jgi:hypothetical protein
VDIGSVFVVDIDDVIGMVDVVVVSMNINNIDK